MIAISIIIIITWFSNALCWQNDIIQKVKDLFNIKPTFKLLSCVYCTAFWYSLLPSLYFYNPITAITIACLTSLLATTYERIIR
jgi:hypothetical protein